MTLDSTTTPPPLSAIKETSREGDKEAEHASSTVDQQMNSPAWRKDPLIGLGGPITRSRAKKMKEALHGLVRDIQRETKLRVEEKPKMITLLKVIEN